LKLGEDATSRASSLSYHAGDQEHTALIHNITSKSLLQIVVAMILVSTACHDSSDSMSPGPFDYQECLGDPPEHVEGLQILSGPRTEKGIIRDMTPPLCGGHALFEQMKGSEEEIAGGSVVFRVVVEYVGEVNRVTIEETTIQSEEFLRKVREAILNTDFVYWRDQTDYDSEFLYPVRFGS
jgi:hypothetical protein